MFNTYNALNLDAPSADVSVYITELFLKIKLQNAIISVLRAKDTRMKVKILLLLANWTSKDEFFRKK